MENEQIKTQLRKSYLGPIEVNKLIRKYQRSKDEAVKDELLNTLLMNHLRLIKKIAFRFNRTSGQDTDDAFQDGVTGFIKAVKAFKPRKEIPFVNFAAICIERNMMRDYSVSSVRIPWDLVRAYRNYFWLLYSGHTEEEIEKHMTDLFKKHKIRFSYKTVRDYVSGLGEKIFSLDKTLIDGEADANYHDVVKDVNAKDPLDECEKKNLTETIKKISISLLSQREQFVVQSRYLENKTLDQTSAALGIHRERVRQIECHALRKLRRGLIEIGLFEDADFKNNETYSSFFGGYK